MNINPSSRGSLVKGVPGRGGTGTSPISSPKEDLDDGMKIIFYHFEVEYHGNTNLGL
jgi:hypothetical protein